MLKRWSNRRRPRRQHKKPRVEDGSRRRDDWSTPIVELEKKRPTRPPPVVSCPNSGGWASGWSPVSWKPTSLSRSTYFESCFAWTGEIGSAGHEAHPMISSDSRTDGCMRFGFRANCHTAVSSPVQNYLQGDQGECHRECHRAGEFRKRLKNAANVGRNWKSAKVLLSRKLALTSVSVRSTRRS